MILGVDIGSVSVAMAALDARGKLQSHQYRLHHGNVRDTFESMFRPYETAGLTGMAAPSGKNRFGDSVRIFDQQVSLMEALELFRLNARSVLHIGAEKFYMIELDGNGGYLQTSHSSSCAAGTGSFLDQQARRLQLAGAEQLSDFALKNNAPVPDIAARCSVFAKTDLIHAQQRGYGLEAICDSLCKGLADNIAGTLFNKSVPDPPVAVTGGVSRNRSVIRHLQRLAGTEFIHHPLSHLFSAAGAAYLLWKESEDRVIREWEPAQLWKEKKKLEYFYEPLKPTEETREKIRLLERKLFQPAVADHTDSVQVELFREPESTGPGFFLGIDVGSTSTKAILLTTEGDPFAGFYTYTAGQPLKAVQALFEAMVRMGEEKNVPLSIKGSATTGSGRKFIGNIIRADQVVDEITAHARAAHELNPETDTIIEIGGQDAKFTQMKDGVVTFSHMNTVCAAGTGSFIEELAGRLGAGLEDYEKKVLGRKAPLASDRCTVFMERDINQLLSSGYPVEEVLATVIHSVRENYLKKVASESHIGEQICFQGATARNRALVAAFEQRLGKPIHVSRLCHLTGALGTALILREEFKGGTHFRGLGLYRIRIPVSTETCELCLNRCTISVAEINGEKEAYGFLCGRDYHTRRFVRKEGQVFDLLKEREKLTGKEEPLKGSSEIGIPSTLHLAADLTYWKAFFRHLGIPVHTSENYRDSLKTGKKIAGAEFCAPIDSMYGHLSYLAENSEYVFMPVYLEARNRPGGTEQNFCYYTQFSASLASVESSGMAKKLVSPMLNFRKNHHRNTKLLAGSLAWMGYHEPGITDIKEAMQFADNYCAEMKLRLESLFTEISGSGDDVEVMLLGRPYVVLSGTLNKGIPDIFAGMGIRAWYQDMLPGENDISGELTGLLEKVPWHFAVNILRAADRVCRKPGLYPVLVTAFKCAPDSFILEYFKQLMDLYDKPYLIIQIDEHDSNVGYETRIEAALRSFRNHFRKGRSVPAPDLSVLLPKVDRQIDGKTLLMPNWDPFVGPLLVANLRRAGIDARMLETTELSIRKSMVHNTGQCLPINIIAQDAIDYIEKHELDPSRVMVWMSEGRITCNLRQYPYYIKRILEANGRGMEKASVYAGEISHRELSLSITYYAYFAYMLGGLFRKTACRIRPYETEPGQTDRVFTRVYRILQTAMEGSVSIDQAIREAMEQVDTIGYDNQERKPLVAIFGDLYVRDNDVMNMDLVRHIEEAGGEALVTPYHDYAKIVIENIFRRAKQRGEHVETTINRIMLNVLKFMDEKYYRYFRPHLGPAPVIQPGRLEQYLKQFNIQPLHSGESHDNILKIFYITENYPNVSLFVQTNPSFCCPALVTEAMTRKIREITGVPIVTLTYDGTADRINDLIVPHIHQAVRSPRNGRRSPEKYGAADPDSSISAAIRRRKGH